MRPNRLIEKMKGPQPALNGWLSMGSTFVAELMANQAWDSLTIDMQHGINDYKTAVEMLRAISTTSVTPIVRVPWNEPGIIQRMLDAGAYGIICPMINTRKDCEAFVSVCRYAPQGSRSFGPVRAAIYGGNDYWQHANDNVLTFGMIETREALANVEEIVSVPGLSGLYIGPADLSLSLGFNPVTDQDHPEVRAAIERIKAAADRVGKFTVMHSVTIEQAKQVQERGFSMITVGNDSRILSHGVAQWFQQLGRDASAVPKPSY